MNTRFFRLLLASLWLVLIANAILQLRSERLHCSREIGDPPDCTFTVSAPFGRVAHLAPGSLAAVEVHQAAQTRRTAPPTFLVVLLDTRGAELPVWRSTDRAEVIAQRDALRAFLADPARPHYVLSREPGFVNYALFAATIGIGIALWMWALRTPPQAPRATDAPRESVTQRLRAWFAQPANRLPLSLFGGALLVGGVVNLALIAHADKHQGWVEFHPEARCRFQNTEMLPGASVQMSLDPGTYEIQVFAPSAPGGWEPQRFDVRIGETTWVACRPSIPAK